MSFSNLLAVEERDIEKFHEDNLFSLKFQVVLSFIIFQKMYNNRDNCRKPVLKSIFMEVGQFYRRPTESENLVFSYVPTYLQKCTLQL